jgi:hypothetical protein
LLEFQFLIRILSFIVKLEFLRGVGFIATRNDYVITVLIYDGMIRLLVYLGMNGWRIVSRVLVVRLMVRYIKD